MTANQVQSAHWNSAESRHWVDHAERYDRQLQPFGDAILGHLDLRPADQVLDVGCGCGATTLAAAAPTRRVLGVDLSEAMLAVARDRAGEGAIENTEFVVADAQTHAFPACAFDAILSRFGVMFFDDPRAAFTNLHQALTERGRLAFVCWQPVAANEWLLVPGLAAAQYVPLPDLGGTESGPGMFSLSDPDRTAALLSDSGFSSIGIEPISPTITLGGGGTVDETVEYLLGTGIARALLDGAAAHDREQAIAAVRNALAAHHEPGVGVRLGTGAWLVSAAA